MKNFEEKIQYHKASKFMARIFKIMDAIKMNIAQIRDAFQEIIDSQDINNDK